MSRIFAVSAILLARLAVAGEAPQEDPLPRDEVQLGDADLRAITLEVLEKYPILASSPGIKYASAQRDIAITQSSVRPIDSADVIFYPHVESAGIKEAFQVQCQRQMPDESWECGDVRLRRYVKLESQDFELRVKGDLDIEAVHAIVQATRVTAQANAPPGGAIPQAAIIIHPVGHGYMVSWGSDLGYQSVTVEACLRKGGNPAVPEDWQTNVFRPQAQ